MGQKVHPESMRVGYIHDWKSSWFNEKQFSEYLMEDLAIRDHIDAKLGHAGLSEITIRKDANEVEVNINTARPGIVIGKGGSEVDALRRELHRLTNKQVKVNILEIKRPELDARLVAQSVAEQLQNRVAFRRAMKRALTSAMRSGAKGVKIQVSGRLGGSEMARTEGYSDGRVPLHTMRADIDYGFVEAKTTFGRIGVKVWINKGEIMPSGFQQDLTELEAPQPVGARPRWRRSRRPWRSGGAAAVAAAAAADAADAAAARVAVAAVRAVAAVAAAAGGGGGRGGRGGGGRRLPGWWSLVLQPKRVKHRKQHRGRMAGNAKGGSHVEFGEYGLKALDRGWITNRQIEAARIAMTRKIKRGGKVWINIFPDKPFTKKPAETRMGSGKGSPEGWVAVVKPGRVMFEMSGVSEELAREAMRLAGHKLPVKTKFVTRESEGSSSEGLRRTCRPGSRGGRAHGQQASGAVQPALPARDRRSWRTRRRSRRPSAIWLVR